ncbi:MAG TPA: hypothetical protein VK437_08980 [Steroidobacteraceae bacterium]|nr:hypothetical protein [Steroidobacteraceae bacterium]
MADPVVDDLERQIEQPCLDPLLPPDDEHTEAYFETLKKFVGAAKNAKDLGLPGAKEFWEFTRLEVLNSAIEDVEAFTSPFGRAARIGKALGRAAMDSKAAIDQFMAVRSANSVNGTGHANPDQGAASVHALLGSSDWITKRFDGAVGNLSMAEVKRCFAAPFLRMRYKFRQHEYLGCAAEALSYFARAKGYYDSL